MSKIGNEKMDTEKRQQLSGSGLRTFFNICHKWDLTELEEADLLGVTPDQVLRWKADPNDALTDDTLTRLSHIFSIYKDLEAISSSERDIKEWVKRTFPHAPFNDRQPLDLMRENIQGLVTVRSYLDAYMDGWA